MSAPDRSESVVRYQAAVVLVTTALSYALMALRQTRDHRISGIVVLALPVVAMLMFLLVTYLVPSILAPRRIAFPLNLTLPVVYCVLLLVSVTLFTSSPSALFQVPEVLLLGRIWAQPTVLVQLGASQVCALTLLAVAKRVRMLS